ncbi:hypothetical protein K440DRAFT_611613 [Wilcoxina mikolae CBS 423.85]|nr:hypothetical protein K440DRAFT_611613 [Wilcoxina mikolae CBS 423.85]
MAQTPEYTLGSAQWTGGAAYGENDEYRNRIANFHSNISESALLSRASQLREGMQCSLSTEFSVGTFNYVRKITFADGIQWIVRLRMPDIERKKDTAASDNLYRLQSEIHTMEFLRANTDIPIPKIHDYSFAQNDLGAPYIFMDYIHGSSAEEVSQEMARIGEDIPEKYPEKFWRQVAAIVVELAAVRFPMIGSITKQDQDNFFPGKLVVTQSGPYSTAEEFYNDYPNELSSSLFAHDNDYMGLPSLFRKVMNGILSEKKASLEHSGPFGLVNLDIGPHNFLVDHDFNIIAMIDLDSVVAYPNALLHQFPMFSEMEDVFPDESNIKPYVKARRERARRFAEFVGEAQTKRLQEKGGERVLTTEGYYSREVVAFRAMTQFQTKQDWVIEKWKQALPFMAEKDDNEILQFYRLELP